MPPKNEAALKRLIKAYIKELDPDCFVHITVETGFGSRFVDIIVCLEGHWLIIETKQPGKIATPRQQATLAAVNAAGGTAFVAHSLRDVVDRIHRCGFDRPTALYEEKYKHRDYKELHTT